MKAEIGGAHVRAVQEADKAFWLSLDAHIPESEFMRKVRDGQGFVLEIDGRLAGILRYNFFWDNTPFCTLIAIESARRRRGLGRKLMEHWENEMRALGFRRLLTSTQADEHAQHFYRALGYTDCGCLLAPGQAAELFMGKDV